ncbi:immunoglobulin domain-containing protein [Opitutus terrae]|nr:immunoglobulin domain-containing protein [Opitutus terrae]
MRLWIPLAFCSALLCLAMHAQSYTFTTLAGEWNKGSRDGAAAVARFNGANGVAIAPNGLVYVADLANSTIRAITPAGVVTTLAGVANVHGCIDGVGSNALFHNPSALVVGPSGDLYVADSNGHAIRKVTPAGVVTTLAGGPLRYGYMDGPGTEAQFSYPRGIAVNATGVIFVSDRSAHTIRRVDQLGNVSTWAGHGGSAGSADGPGDQARFRDPEGLAIDAAGNVYVADINNHTIRKINPAGEVTTLAGAAGESGFADGPAANARFFCPTSLAIDPAGAIWVNDAINRAIRKISPEGTVTTVADTAGEGITIDPNGVLYIAADDRIKRLESGSVLSVVAGPTDSYTSRNGVGANARFVQPIGSALAVDGNLYVTDSGGYAIRRVTRSGEVSTLAGLLGYPGFRDGSGYAAQFRDLRGITPDKEGNLLVGDGRTIRKVTLAGAVTTIAGADGEDGDTDGPAASARFRAVDGLAVDSSGNIFVVDRGASTIRKISQGIVTTFAGMPGETGQDDGAGAAARFRDPMGIVIDGADNLYVADTNNWKIRKVTPAGVVTTFAGHTSTQGANDGPIGIASFFNPYGLAIGPNGALYVVDLAGDTLRMISPDGFVTTLGGSSAHRGETADGIGTAARFYGPMGVSVDRFGIIHIIEYYTNLVRRGVPTGARTAVISSNPAEQRVVEGTAASFSVAASGLPAPQFRWERKRIGDTTFLPLAEGGAYAGVETSTLKVSSPTLIMNGELYRCVVDNGIGAAVASTNVSLFVIDLPDITTQPTSATVRLGATVQMTVSATCSKAMSYEWYRNGEILSGATSRTLTIPDAAASEAGQYHVRITTPDIAVDSQSAVIAVEGTTPVAGNGRLVGPDIVHANGHIYDQVLLEGKAVVVTADQQQMTRTSFLDLDGDIVQVEFSGSGSLAVVLMDNSGPAQPEKYNQNVSYAKGHAGIVITGADESTNVSVFSVGSITAIDQGLFRAGVEYDGLADIGFILISSRNGRFGGIRTGNAVYFGSDGLTGIYAPGVQIVGPVVVGDILAFDNASPTMIFGDANDVRIAGGGMDQPNGQPVRVSGISQIRFVDGMNSHARPLPAQLTTARFEQDGQDVTDAILVGPTH